MDYLNYIKKIWNSIENTHKRQLNIFLAINLVTAFLEILSIGMILPLLHLIVDSNTNDQKVEFVNDLIMSLKNYIGIDNLLFAFLITIIFIFIIKNVFLGYFIWWQKNFIKKVHVSIAQRLFYFYLNKDYSFHLKNNSSVILRNITSEVGNFTNSLANILILFTEMIIFILIFGLLMSLSPISTLIVLVIFGIPSFLFLLFINKYIRKWGEKALNYNAKSLKYLNQGLSSVKEIILLSKQREFVKLFVDQLKKMQILARTTSSIKMLPRLFFEVLTITSISSIIFFMYEQNNVAAIIPTIGIFFAAAIRVLPSIYKIIFSFNTIGQSMKSVDILSNDINEYNQYKNEYNQYKNEYSKVNTKVEINEELEVIKINKINFSYDINSPIILKELFLEIKKGENIGIIGSSGVGKTTFLDVLLGLLKPNSGEITYNNKNIFANIKKWQSMIGYVPQEVNLIDDSIIRNICFNFENDNYDKELLDKVLNKSKLKEFIENCNDGLLTTIGERGARISGGQRQRIGIARALYRRAPILVFDEATNSLDKANRDSFIQNINEIKKDKIIINIAHDLESLKFCDKIYTLKDGCLINLNKN